MLELSLGLSLGFSIASAFNLYFKRTRRPPIEEADEQTTQAGMMNVSFWADKFIEQGRKLDEIIKMVRQLLARG